MPRTLTQYRVFIACPSGLDPDRRRFREKLEQFSRHHGEPRGVVFHPVGWEETIGGVGRPQALINEDFRTCDYAVFLLHDHWGNPTGSGHSSGFDEEWALAQALYDAKTLRNYVLFCKPVDPGKLRDPGPQLHQVLTFQKQIIAEKRHLFRRIEDTDGFIDGVEGFLAEWLRDHERLSTTALQVASPAPSAGAPAAPAPPGFEYWIAEARNLSAQSPADALYTARKALETADGDGQWAEATNAIGVAAFHLGQLADALSAFDAVASRLEQAREPPLLRWHALARLNGALTLGALGRNEEAIAAYDDLLARFGTATEPALREPVAKALVNKGARLGALGRNEEAIAAYDNLLARFGAATEPALRVPVANALVNKGVRLGALGQNEAAIAAYDDLLARFGTATEPALREQVAKALVNKGVSLSRLGRSEDEIAAYDDLLARFGTSDEPPVRRRVAKALHYRGWVLETLERWEDAASCYTDLAARFRTDSDPEIQAELHRAVKRAVALCVRAPP